MLTKPIESRRALCLGVLASTLVTALQAAESSRIDGSGRVLKQQRAVSGFSGIDLELPANVEVIQGPREGVYLETDDNIASHIETVVENERLRIRPAKRSTTLNPSRLNITVYVRSLEQINIAGAGTVDIKRLQTPALTLSIAGTGRVNVLALDADTLTLRMAGNGTVSMAGRADAVRADISGAGDIGAAGLATQTFTLAIAGAGTAQLWVSEALNLSVVGSGDVSYWGDAVVTKSISGVGQVKRLGSAPPK
jgi:hypothetical protein